VATYDEKNQPERPFGVSERELESVRSAWIQSQPGEGLFNGPIPRELQHYFNTSLNNSRFALENLQKKVENENVKRKLSDVKKSLDVCSEIGKVLFRYGCAE